MTYPPAARAVNDPALAAPLLAAHPFGHLLTDHGGLAVTRVPFIADLHNGRPIRLRAHLNAANPQARGLDGAAALAAFSGPAAYVSPNWRADRGRAGTWDYEAAHLRGTARVVADIVFFRRLIDDLSALVEPGHRDIGEYPVWSTADAPPGYIERLFPFVTPFVIEVESVEVIAKLHQGYSDADRRSVADHLARSGRQEVRAVAARIRAVMEAEN